MRSARRAPRLEVTQHFGVVRVPDRAGIAVGAAHHLAAILVDRHLEAVKYVLVPGHQELFNYTAVQVSLPTQEKGKARPQKLTNAVQFNSTFFAAQL